MGQFRPLTTWCATVDRQVSAQSSYNGKYRFYLEPAKLRFAHSPRPENLHCNTAFVTHQEQIPH